MGTLTSMDAVSWGYLGVLVTIYAVMWLALLVWVALKR